MSAEVKKKRSRNFVKRRCYVSITARTNWEKSKSNRRESIFLSRNPITITSRHLISAGELTWPLVRADVSCSFVFLPLFFLFRFLFLERSWALRRNLSARFDSESLSEHRLVGQQEEYIHIYRGVPITSSYYAAISHSLRFARSYFLVFDFDRYFSLLDCYGK